MIKMLIESSSKGSSYQAKQESSDNINKATPSTITSSSSRSQWSAFRNPRIVRVSRTFGGKDRHSKVCTIRGLRDRRIRLSVPTAIQLYDLQEKLGLSQPSKVIDWLIEVTKLDIDKLPPLHFPQGFFPPHQLHHHPHHHMLSMMSGGSSAAAGGGFYDGGSYQGLLAKGKWIKTSTITNNQHENGSCYDDQDHGTIGDSSAQKLFPIGTNSSNNSSLSGLMNNAMAYNNNNYHNSDQVSSLSLSQFGGSHGLLFPSQLLDPHHPGSSGNGVQFSSSNLPLATPQPIFSPYYAQFMANLSMESGGDPRQINNHVQFLSSSSSQVMPLIPSSMMNSPLRRIPTPFSSKLLDSDHNNNRSSQADDKE